MADCMSIPVGDVLHPNIGINVSREMNFTLDEKFIIRYELATATTGLWPTHSVLTERAARPLPYGHKASHAGIRVTEQINHPS